MTYGGRLRRRVDVVTAVIEDIRHRYTIEWLGIGRAWVDLLLGRALEQSPVVVPDASAEKQDLDGVLGVEDVLV